MRTIRAPHDGGSAPKPPLRAPGFVFATLAGLTLAACQLALGFGDKDFSNGTGGASSSTNHGPSTSTSMSSTGGTAGSGTGGQGGMVSGTAGGHDGGMDAGMDAGDQPVAQWAVRFSAADAGSGPTVNAMAVDANGNVYLTGATNGAGDFGCAKVTKNDTGAGYLLELDAKGSCVSLFLFGDGTSPHSAQGTGVAGVDAMGHVALTGTFDGSVTIDLLPAGPASDAGTKSLSMTSKGMDSFVAVLDSTNDYGAVWAAQIGEDSMSGSGVGDQQTTGVALNGSTLAVSGSYTGSLGVSAQMGSNTYPPGKYNNAADMGGDGFAIWFDPTSGAPGGYAGITAAMMETANAHAARGVAVDMLGTLSIVGNTVGDTQLSGFAGTPKGSAIGIGSMFLMGYNTGNNQAPFGNTVDSTTAQVARSVALLGTDQIIAGTFPSNLTVPAPDGGTVAYSGNGGTSALVARYSGGMPIASLALAADTTDTKIAGALPDATGASVFFAGTFSGTASFQNVMGTPSVDSATTAGTTAIYVARVEPMLGDVIWARAYHDGNMPPQGQSADAIAVDPTGDLLIAGQFLGALDLGNSVKLSNGTGSAQLYVAKIKP